MSDLRKIEKNRNKEKIEKRIDFSHDLKRKEHLKPSVYSINEIPFNPNINDVEQPTFNPNVMKSKEKLPFNPNSDIKKNNSNIFTMGYSDGGGEGTADGDGMVDKKIKRTDVTGDPEDINSITINIDLSDIKKEKSNIFTSDPFVREGDGTYLGDDL